MKAILIGFLVFFITLALLLLIIFDKMYGAMLFIFPAMAGLMAFAEIKKSEKGNT